MRVICRGITRGFAEAPGMGGLVPNGVPCSRWVSIMSGAGSVRAGRQALLSWSAALVAANGSRSDDSRRV